MAFTNTDKECLRNYVSHLFRVSKTRKLTDEEAGHLETITVGDEADKVVVAKWYAEHIVLSEVQAHLATLDATKTALETEETELQSYLT